MANSADTSWRPGSNELLKGSRGRREPDQQGSLSGRWGGLGMWGGEENGWFMWLWPAEEATSRQIQIEKKQEKKKNRCMNKLWFVLMGTMQRKKNSGHTAGPRRFWHVHSCGALMAKVTAAGLDCFKRKMEARRLQPRCRHPPQAPPPPRTPGSPVHKVCRSFNRGGRNAENNPKLLRKYCWCCMEVSWFWAVNDKHWNQKNKVEQLREQQSAATTAVGRC